MSLTAQQAMTPSRAGVAVSKASKRAQQHDIDLPDYRSPAPSNTAERRGMSNAIGPVR